jgi:negative regulator of sigma E activity
MTTPAPNGLTPEQRELLSAHLDGETTPSESAAAELLLQSTEAREYFDELAATRALVIKHAAVRAPVGLSGRVLDALELSPTEKAGTLSAMPRMSWHAPLWAAAAAVILSLGVMFGPSIFSPSAPDHSDIARTALDNLTPSAGTDEPQVQAAPHDETQDPNFGGPGSDPFNRKGGPVTGAPKPEGDWGVAGEKAGRNAAEGADKETADAGKRSELEELKSEAERGGQGGGMGRAAGSLPAPRTARLNDDKNSEKAEKDDRAVDPAESEKSLDDANEAVRRAKGRASAPGDAQTDGEPANEERAQPDRARDTDGAPPPPAAPAQPAEAAPELVYLDVTEGGNIAAQNDFLWVSSLYGKAELVENQEESDVESISVELDADKLAELLAALRKLADDQGYGRVDGAKGVNRDPEADAADNHVQDGRRITGYLPTPGETAAAEPAKEQARTVRVVIRLK